MRSKLRAGIYRSGTMSGAGLPEPALDIVIEMKLVGMGAQPDGIDLLFSLVVEPGFDHVAGEHIAAQQERVIAFERVKRLVQRSGRRFILCVPKNPNPDVVAM